MLAWSDQGDRFVTDPNANKSGSVGHGEPYGVE